MTVNSKRMGANHAVCVLDREILHHKIIAADVHHSAADLVGLLGEFVGSLRELDAYGPEELKRRRREKYLSIGTLASA